MFIRGEKWQKCIFSSNFMNSISRRRVIFFYKIIVLSLKLALRINSINIVNGIEFHTTIPRGLSWANVYVGFSSGTCTTIGIQASDVLRKAFVLEIREASFHSVKHSDIKLFSIQSCFILLYAKFTAKSFRDHEI